MPARDPYAKLMDCGLTKMLKGAAGEAAAAAGVSFTGGLVAGTAGYMAPEVASAKYDVQSEVFSMGVVLLELFMGQRVGTETATEISEAAEDDGPQTLLARADDGVWPADGAPLRCSRRSSSSASSQAPGHGRGHEAAASGARAGRRNGHSAAPRQVCHLHGRTSSDDRSHVQRP